MAAKGGRSNKDTVTDTVATQNATKTINVPVRIVVTAPEDPEPVVSHKVSGTTIPDEVPAPFVPFPIYKRPKDDNSPPSGSLRNAVVGSTNGGI